MAMSDRMKQLMEEKEKLESTIEAYTEFLTTPNMPGLTGNILDKEGFPRADVDLY